MCWLAVNIMRPHAVRVRSHRTSHRYFAGQINVDHALTLSYRDDDDDDRMMAIDACEGCKWQND